ncbi:hypothetical protein B2M27_25340 [Kluyvera intermedia]|uniref:RelA/SpoT domain-containing protein n=1 Tax=Kluyvera intermedia TaxID=61648 RepID=A0ABX3U8I7_KLUIN|nr:RelA/SpoT domain-containing protein [Kluyvera intermedia]ORJ47574.1 hypothetical protein B2M27_25340 [Kluyvera intermedia]
MTDYDEFQKYLENNYKVFESWGHYVADTIIGDISAKLGGSHIKSFIKIPVEPRVKEINSALGKVARKGYSDPISQMTDLVGARFVVLLSEDLELISDVIENNSSFVATVSKNYQEEIMLNPKLFDYQSKHYEVRPKVALEIDGLKVPENICCEVQIRTLLQHAYAELVHDNIYKPTGIVPKAAERHIARSMALMETTDDLFCATMKLLYDTNKHRNRLNEALCEIYRDTIGSGYMHYDESTNFVVLDAFKENFSSATESETRELISKKTYLPPRIRSRSTSKTLFSQPCILFIYYLIKNLPVEKIRDQWPLPGYIHELELAFSDLGFNSRR